MLLENKINKIHKNMMLKGVDKNEETKFPAISGSESRKKGIEETFKDGQPAQKIGYYDMHSVKDYRTDMREDEGERPIRASIVNPLKTESLEELKKGEDVFMSDVIENKSLKKNTFSTISVLKDKI